MSVYFVTCRDHGIVKIGHAANPQKRIQGFQTASAFKLTLELTIEGGAAEERKLHQRFADCRERGEWFRITPKIDEFIREHQPKPKYTGFHQGQLIGPLRFDPEGWLDAHRGCCDDMPWGVEHWLRYRAGEFA